MKICYIKWRDSARFDDQGKNDFEWEVCVFESVGFLLREDKNATVITRDIIGNESRGVIIIPNENIVQKKMIKI